VKKTICTFLAILALSACQTASKDNTALKESMVSVIKENLSGPEECYNTYFKNKNFKTVTLEVAWCVNSDGSVTDLKAKQNLKNKELQKCVLDKFQTYKFPVPSKDIHPCASYNYTFDTK
jgi:hypothetical protein